MNAYSMFILKLPIFNWDASTTAVLLYGFFCELYSGGSLTSISEQHKKNTKKCLHSVAFHYD